MFVFHTLVNCSALAFFIFSRLKLVPPSAERSVHDHQIHHLRKRWRHNKWVILVNMEISVILGHEKTKIRNIIDYGKIDVISVRTIIHIKNKMMGHLIWPFGVLLYKIFQKWDVPRWHKAGWMIVLTCQTHLFCNTSTILAQYKFQMKNFVFNLHFFYSHFASCLWLCHLGTFGKTWLPRWFQV